MKLSHLSLAIFSAIALAACGGSSSNSPTDNNPPPPPPKPQPKPVPDNGNADKIVDPTQTGVVGDLDYNENPSRGTLQYIRGKKSKFDRVDNPTEKTSSTSILGVDLNEQNPQLSNIVLARLPDPSTGNVLVQLAGNMPSYAANIWDPHSLQRQNELNVEIPALGTPNTATLTTDLENRKKEFEKIRDAYKVVIDAGTASSDNRRYYAEVLGHIATLESLIDSVNSSQTFGDEVIPFYSDLSSYKWGDDARTSSPALGEKGLLSGSDGPRAPGLVAMNYQEYNNSTGFKKLAVQGTEEKSLTSTRIFGRNFNTIDAVTLGSKAYSNTMNSYLGAGVHIYNSAGDNLSASGPLDTDVPANEASYKAWVKNAYGDVDTDTLPLAANIEDQVGYTLGVVPMNLDKVQYGRVTADLDPPSMTTVTAPVVYQRQNFRTKGDDKAVDTYFYRGVDATTLTQMDALKDKKLTYRGHALMYGVENRFIGKLGANVPNAVGNGGRHGIGNFVSADVDLSDKTIRGGIYNVWQQGPNDADLTEDVIVTFSGKIHGNTALGEAERTYKEGKADFRASFFGIAADELGGSINSTTYEDVYGPKDGKDVWGGVFGAKSVAGGLSNKWLGDIPKVK